MDVDDTAVMVRGRVSIVVDGSFRGCCADFEMAKSDFESLTNDDLVERFIAPAGIASAERLRRNLKEEG